MKTRIRIVISVILFFLVVNSYGQEDAVNNISKQEVRWDAFDFIALENFEFHYEYVINTYSGIGVALGANFSSPLDSEYKFAVEPFYRQYFFNEKDYGARGFFVEGLTRIAMGEQEVSDQFSMPEIENWTDFGIGIGLGQKWVRNNKFVVEISAGIGRYILSGNDNGFFARVINKNAFKILKAFLFIRKLSINFLFYSVVVFYHLLAYLLV